MKDLTIAQLTAIQNLEKHSLIAKTGIEFENGIARISIRSTVGAIWDEVESLIESELGELFPGYEYFGSPAKYTNPIDGIEQELYFINFEGVTLIDLTMRLSPVKWQEAIE